MDLSDGSMPKSFDVLLVALSATLPKQFSPVTDETLLNEVTNLKQKILKSHSSLKQCYLLHQCAVLDPPDGQLTPVIRNQEVHSFFGIVKPESAMVLLRFCCSLSILYFMTTICKTYFQMISIFEAVHSLNLHIQAALKR